MILQKKLGIPIIILSLIITLNLFIASKQSVGIIFNHPLLSLGQIFSLIGTILLCFSFVLSSKLSRLENWFGGFDKVYKTHHAAGAIAFVLLLLHPLFLIVDALPNKKLAVLYVLPSNIWSYNFGIIALWTMIFLIVLTIFVKLPYHVWKKTHEYMGLALLLGALHIFLVTSDVSRFAPLRVWMFSFIFVALSAYIYARFLYKHFGPKYNYVVEYFRRDEDLIELFLRPVGKSLPFSPGQFAFLQFENKELNSEEHPFSISSDPQSSFLRFSIKIVGDYTLNLRELEKGSKVRVFGPYGSFFEKFSKCSGAVCIAGGIGITPFLGMLAQEVKKEKNDKEIFLYYCERNENEFFYDNEVKNLSMACSSIKYIPHCSSQKGRLKADQILQTIGSLKDKLIFLCGPAVMMKDLRKQFLKCGVNSNNIIFEDFNFR